LFIFAAENIVRNMAQHIKTVEADYVSATDKDSKTAACMRERICGIFRIVGSKTTEIYMHVSTKNIQNIVSSFDMKPSKKIFLTFMAVINGLCEK
jgi:hypothetical protein